MMKKILSCVIVIVLAFTMFVGCRHEGGGGGTDNEVVNTDKTQLYVGTYDGGNGTEWLYSAKARFEEQYKDTVFEPGKKGVQVMISKSASFNAGLSSTISTLREEIFFTCGADYYELTNSGSMLDITDILSGADSDLSSMGDSGTIEDKMSETYKKYLKTKDGKYFAVPFYEATYGIFYDISLFCDKGLYFDSNGEIIGISGKIDTKNGKFITKSGDEFVLSTGPDGKNNTFDDGLPRTYDEYFDLCNIMYKRNIVPVTWPGAHTWHVNNLYTGLCADSAGAEQQMLNYTLNGTATDIIEYNTDGSMKKNPDGTIATRSEKITTENGYLLSDTTSKFYSLQFLERLIKDKNNYDEDLCFGGGNSHLTNQYHFVSGKHISGLKTIGMIVDGNWWYNEARTSIDTVNKNYGSSSYGILPLPKKSMADLGPYTILETDRSLGFIKSVKVGLAEEKVELAKLFLKYVNTNASLVDFITTSNFSRAMSYTMTDAEHDKLTEYGKNMYTAHKECNFLSPYDSNDFFLKNMSKLVESLEICKTEKYSMIADTFSNYANITAEDYFKGMTSYHSAKHWADTFGK